VFNITRRIDLMKYYKEIKIIKNSGLFDAQWYLRNYPDVKSVGIDPLLHYIKIGWYEKRNPSNVFFTGSYLKKHPELISKNKCPLLHYLETIVPDQVVSLIKPFDFNTIYELGNKKTNDKPYSIYYNSLGKDYVSIDLNGLDGALKLDLCEAISLPSRDIVFNIGTSEHVVEQEKVFLNIHNLSHHRMVHWVPFEKKHPEHGMWGYSKEFFIRLASINSYKIEKLYVEESFRNWTLLCCSLKKKHKDKEFVWRDDLPLFYNEKGSFGVSLQ